MAELIILALGGVFLFLFVVTAVLDGLSYAIVRITGASFDD